MAEEKILLYILFIGFYVTTATWFQEKRIRRSFISNRRILNIPSNSLLQSTNNAEDFPGISDPREKVKGKGSLRDVRAISKYWSDEEQERPVYRRSLNPVESQIRRFYWQPIFDGHVISLIGNFFSDNLKEESNRERTEREKLRERELHEKYAGMLSDPEQLKLLREEAKNSPTYINQVVRRSLPASRPGRQRFRYFLR